MGNRDGIERPQPAIARWLVADAHASGLTAVNVTLGYVAGPDEPFEYTIRTIGTWDQFVRAYPDDVLKVYNAVDILTARDAGKIGLIYGFQNATMVRKRRARRHVRCYGRSGDPTHL